MQTNQLGYVQMTSSTKPNVDVSHFRNGRS